MQSFGDGTIQGAFRLGSFQSPVDKTFLSQPYCAVQRCGQEKGCWMPFEDKDKKDDKDEDSLLENVPEKVNVTLPGTVEKIIPAIGNQIPEKAQIQLEGADELYREIRIENTPVTAPTTAQGPFRRA